MAETATATGKVESKEGSAAGSALNNYCKKTGYRLMLALPLLIILTLVLGAGLLIGDDPAISIGDPFMMVALGLWALLFLNSFAFSVNGFKIFKAFKNKVAEYASKGLPFDSTDGFDQTKLKVGASLTSGYLITFTSLISLVFMVISLTGENVTPTITPQTMLIFAMAMALIMLAILVALKLPNEPSLEPGALLGYYIPRKLPMTLDNILGDSIKEFLDPISLFQYDDWIEDIDNKMNPTYEDDEDHKTRVERAVEKIILMVYLRTRMATLVTEKVFEKELSEVIRGDQLQRFKDGTDSGFPLKLVEKLVKSLRKHVAEIFNLVDNLFLDLFTNAAVFEDKDFYIKMMVPDMHGGILEPIRTLVYMLDLRDEGSEPAVLEVRAEASRSILEPHTIEINMELDEPDDEVKDGIKKWGNQPITEESADEIFDLISSMLQVGDAAWLMFQPSRLGNAVLNLFVELDDTIIASKGGNVRVKMNLAAYGKKYGGKVSGVGGAILPVLGLA